MVLATDTSTFYAQLPFLEQLRDIADADHFHDVPTDWYFAFTDIIGSTRAIQQGRYQDVNLIAACSITVVLNATRPYAIPFIFGGDGASLLIPPHLVDPTRKSLQGIQWLAATQFKLNLRAALVPLRILQDTPHTIRIAKLQMSPNFAQAVFSGGGLKYLEELLKSSAGVPYQLTAYNWPDVDYSGLECRWQDIPSPGGEVVSLLVQVAETDPWTLCGEVIEQIESIYGPRPQRHPCSPEQLKLHLTLTHLEKEVRVKGAGQNPWKRWLGRVWILVTTVLAAGMMRFKLKTPDGDWGTYREQVVAATDIEKFDDALRMVLKGTPQQRQALTDYLETRYQENRLVYGSHVSNRALMTCLVFERFGQQVHFVDGADGGYALAAMALKVRVRAQAHCISTDLVPPND